MKKFLNELEAGNMLSSYGIPMAKSIACKTIDEALKEASKLKFPLVMKILSPDIQHKTDAGCVILNVKNIEELEKSFIIIINNAKEYDNNAKIDGILMQEMAPKGLEVIIGMKRDPQFGPVVMVGMGGIYVEVFKDVSLRLIPVKSYDVEEMIKETKLYKIIQGARGIKYDMECLVNVILRLSKMVEKQSEIQEIDINPFFLYGEGKGGKGVDALIKI
ncbi:MAG: acetate--CoA ligase family protein [Firmicutes bacterium]|nr:acetate--CoA ligase family protein [Bacillota bacterium]